MPTSHNAAAIEKLNKAVALGLSNPPNNLNQWIDSQVNGTMSGLPEDVREWAGEIARSAVVMVFANKAALIDNLCNEVHADNVRAGWWNDLQTGEPLQRNVGELLCLVHSEISEAMEGHRKNLADDKLPHRPMFRVELIDAMIRIFDILGRDNREHRAGDIFMEKRAYNAQRADHKPENRRLAGGKAF